MQIGPRGGGGAVGIDDDELGATFAARRRDMGHHIDLGRDRVAAPDDDQVGFGDLAPVDPALGADPGEPARIGERIADRQILARIAHRMAQPVDAVALHQPHRPGVVIGPHGLRAVALGGPGQRIGDLVERRRPKRSAQRRRALPFLADPAQRLREALRVVLALGIACDLGADHTLRIVLRRGPRTRPISRPSTRSTSSAQALGQSCGHTLGTMSSGKGSLQLDPQNIGTGQRGRAPTSQRRSVRLLSANYLVSRSGLIEWAVRSRCEIANFTQLFRTNRKRRAYDQL